MKAQIKVIKCCKKGHCNESVIGMFSDCGIIFSGLAFKLSLVVKAMFIDGNDNPIPCFKSDTSMRISLVICLTGILLLGIAGCVYRFFFNMAIIP